MSAPMPDKKEQSQGHMDASQSAPSFDSAERGTSSISRCSTLTKSNSTDFSKSEKPDDRKSRPSRSTNAPSGTSTEHAAQNIPSTNDQTPDGVTAVRAARNCAEKHLIGRQEALFLMLKTELGLGMLTIPLIFSKLGLVGGILALVGVRLTTFACGYTIGTFMMNNHQVQGIADAGRLVFKRFGNIGYFFTLIIFYGFLTFVTASIMIAMTDGLNAITGHSCTAIYLPIAFATTFVGSSIPSLGRITWVAYLGVAFITAAVATFAGILGAKGGPIGVPHPSTWHPDWHRFADSSIHAIFAALSTTLFANSGTPAFFSIMAEMREPRKYFHTLYICHGIMVAIYGLIGITVYLFSGTHINPALFSTLESTPEKVCWGLALIGLIPSAILLSHIPAKDFFIRTQATPLISREKKLLSAKWLGYTFGFTFLECLIANVLPVFNELVSLIGAIFGPILILQLSAAMWLHDNWRRENKDKWWAVGAILSISGMILGLGLLVIGSIGSGVELKNALDSSVWTKPFTCPAPPGTTRD